MPVGRRVRNGFMSFPVFMIARHRFQARQGEAPDMMRQPVQAPPSQVELRVDHFDDVSVLEKEGELRDDAERRAHDRLVLDGSPMTWAASERKSFAVGRSWSWTSSSKAAVGAAISRSITRVAQLSGRTVERQLRISRRKKVSIFSSDRSLSSAKVLERPEIYEPAVGLAQDFQVELLLAPEVVVYRSRVYAGQVADLPGSRPVESFEQKEARRPR